MKNKWKPVVWFEVWDLLGFLACSLGSNPKASGCGSMMGLEVYEASEARAH